MKRIIAVLLLAASLLTLVGCGPKESVEAEVNAGIQSSTVVDPYSVEGTGEQGASAVDSAKESYNRLTGLYDLANDRVGYRPIAVSVNNINVAWPQYGISKADIIYEIETEGGITRLMAMFSDTREIEKIGSVRSLRDQFIEATFPLNPIIVHIGTSVFADEVMEAYGIRTLDGYYNLNVYWRDPERLGKYSYEHTAMTSGASILKSIESSGMKTDSTSSISAFNFIDPDEEKVVPTTGAAGSVTCPLSANSMYDLDLRYDAESGKYLKYQRGNAQVDAGNDNKQLAFDNAFVIFCHIDFNSGTDLIHAYYEEGGEAYYFSQGQYQHLTWTKDDFSSNFVFTTDDGEELRVNTGKSYLCVINETRMDKMVIA